jgi:hypothetical protein
MKIRIGDLIRYKGCAGRIGIGIVIEQPFHNYPVWRVLMEYGERMTLSLDQIVEVVNESR